MTRRSAAPARVVLLLAVVAACDATASDEHIDAPPPVASTGSPLAGIAPAAADDREFDGVVRERLPAGTYVYLAIESERGLRWVATTGSSAATGTRVHVQSMGTRKDFHSRRLDRSFDELVFGVVVPAATHERTRT